MQTQGIRILDKHKHIVSVELPDIISEITNGGSFYWSILYLDAMGDLGEGKSIPIFQQQIEDSDKGVFVTWEYINLLAVQLYELMDLTLIGSKNQSLLHRYPNEKKMYASCDIVIEMIDSSYWKVFSKDAAFIHKLAAKFKETELLDPDFEK